MSAAHSWIEFLEVTNALVCLVQETRTLLERDGDYTGKFSKLGWKAVLQLVAPHSTRPTSPSGGVVICVRQAFGLRLPIASQGWSIASPLSSPCHGCDHRYAW